MKNTAMAIVYSHYQAEWIHKSLSAVLESLKTDYYILNGLNGADRVYWVRVRTFSAYGVWLIAEEGRTRLL